MMKSCVATLAGTMAACATLVIPAFAEEYIEYPLDRPGLPFQRSYLSGEAVVVPPYRHVFPVRVYTTPPQQPYYNVPPYRVISPY